MTNFTSVKKFMKTFGQEVKTKAEFPSDKIVKLRYDLIKEELNEFISWNRTILYNHAKIKIGSIKTIIE